MSDTMDPMATDVDQQELAQQLLAQATEQGNDLVGPGGLLNRPTKNVLETALEAEMEPLEGISGLNVKSGQTSNQTKNPANQKRSAGFRRLATACQRHSLSDQPAGKTAPPWASEEAGFRE
jgi:hypothetical protein